VQRGWISTAMRRALGVTLGAMTLAGCDSTTVPKGAVRLDVSPADTTVALGVSIPLDVHLFNTAGVELPRERFDIRFLVADPRVATVGPGDVVKTVGVGTTRIALVASTDGDDLRREISVTVPENILK